MYKFENVSSLNNFIRSVFADNEILSDFMLTGEISSYTVSSRGHAYFTLKDAGAVISCVIFAGYLSQVSFRPVIGDKVVVTGKIDYYTVGGRLQMIVDTMRKSGEGDLHEQYKKLFDKLEKEGLFSPEHKRPLPVLPRRIGVITSASGRVISDIVNTIRKRNPYFDLLLYPASVQGENCPREVIAGLDYFYKRHNVDVIIVARGGGSYEDLFGFNDEGIARKVYEIDIPVISAIGHDPDITILDYVADLRAPTPTGAAEYVIAVYGDQKNSVDNLSLNLDLAVSGYVNSRRNILNGLINHKALHSPTYYCRNQRVVLSGLEERLRSTMTDIVKTRRGSLDKAFSGLNNLNPKNVLKRGYSYVSSANGEAIESVRSMAKGDIIEIVFADGSASGQINEVNANNETGE